MLPFNPKLKKFLFVLFIIILVTADIVVSRIKGANDLPVVDALVYESGSDDIDGYTGASIKTHVSIVKSDYPGLSFSKSVAEDLNKDELREMVFKAISLDRHYGTTTPELKFAIDSIANIKSGVWVSIMPNLNSYPGVRFMPGDETDPRIISAVIDYIADSTLAKRISLLAGGSYGNYSGEKDIFTTMVFGTTRWNNQYPELPASFTLQSILDSAQTRHPDKIIEGINTNYNEILTGGVPYNELDSASRAGLLPEYYPVPSGKNGLKGFSTSNFITDSGKYNPTDAVKNSDFLINVPVMKITNLAGGLQVNCVFKNYVGSVSRAVYSNLDPYPQDRSSSLGALDHSIFTLLNLFSYHPSDYCIVDATSSLEGPGSHPWSGRTAWLKRNFVMAGSDPVAVEASAALTMRLNPNDIDLIRFAYAKGFGSMDKRRVKFYGSPMSSVETDIIPDLGENSIYRFPDFNTVHYMGRGCRRWLLNGPYSGTDLSQEYIDEASADPRPGDLSAGLPWVPYYSSQDSIDLTQALSNTVTNSITYAFSQIYSDSAKTGKLYVGGVRDIRVYVNGQKLIDTSFSEYSNVNVIKDVSLNAGDNRILVKIRRSGSIYKFSLAMVNSGLESSRTTFKPYINGGRAVGNDVTLTNEMKRALFGGRTLFGTFYHLGQSDAISVENGSTIVSEGLFLSGNYPNPFISTTSIKFSQPLNAAFVELDIFNTRGEKVKEIFKGIARKGVNAFTWNGFEASGKQAASGVYYCRLKTASKTLVRRITYLH